MQQPVTIITGLGGQDGSILAEQLLEKGHKIYGVVRRRSDSPNLGCAKALEGSPGLEVVEGDITDLSFLDRLCKSARPNWYVNCAAQSHVHTSFEEPVHTLQVTGGGVLNALEAIRNSGIHTRFLQCSTSELFGGITDLACDEESNFYPQSPYAAAKLYGYWITCIYRNSYRMFACNALSFNHEFEGKRGPNFLTRKVTLSIANIKAGNQEKLYLGNLEAKRDWSHAGDMCRGFQLILEASKPDDFVLGSGQTHSVREFCKEAFEYAGLGNYQDYVEIDPRFFRPAEVDVLLADYSKAKRELGWEPTVTFKELVHRMVDHDLELVGVKDDH